MKKIYLLFLILVSVLVLPSCQIHGRFTLDEYFNSIENIYLGDLVSEDFEEECKIYTVEESVPDCVDALKKVETDIIKRRLLNESNYMYKVKVKGDDFKVIKDSREHTYTFTLVKKIKPNKGDDYEEVTSKGINIQIIQKSATSWKLKF